jgi:hypothetical protein
MPAVITVPVRRGPEGIEPHGCGPEVSVHIVLIHLSTVLVIVLIILIIPIHHIFIGLFFYHVIIGFNAVNHSPSGADNCVAPCDSEQYKDHHHKQKVF